MKAQLETVPNVSKKDQILTLVEAGVSTVEELALLTSSRPSYVVQVLRDAHLLQGYFDLYTSTDRPMNVYSKYFAKRLGFRSVTAAKRGVERLNLMYSQFGRIGDRAGQHHTMLLALTMRNRAVWTGKQKEAAIYARWLQQKLREMPTVTAEPKALLKAGAAS